MSGRDYILWFWCSAIFSIKSGWPFLRPGLFGWHDIWWWLACFLPSVPPITLALLPDEWNSSRAELRRAASPGMGAPAKATAEALEDRFPLLVECLSGQPEQIRTSLTARFQPVKANLEFALAVAPDAAGRLLEETRNGGFEVTTGEQGALVSVYGAGLVRPDKVDELAGRLIAAAAPGQTVKIAFRDAEGLLHFAEHHSERTAATGA